MSIPRINNGDTLRDVREKSLNPVINLVNEHEVELGEKSILIAQNAAKSIQNAEAIEKLMMDVVSNGDKFIVDNRAFTYSTSGSYCVISADLEADEYPVRAVVRSFDTSAKKGTFVPCSGVQFDRTTGVITADVGHIKDGTIFVEFWKKAK